MTPEEVLAVQESITSCVPSPESELVCGLPVALSAMLRAAVREPAAPGVKDIVMAQFAPAANEEPQVLFSVKSVALAPVMVMPVILKAALPVFESVTTCDPLATSTGSFPKETLEGEALAVGLALAPVPERLTLCGLPVALSVKVRAAVCAPLAAGLKDTLTVQLAPAATLEPQVLVCVKSLGSAPERATLSVKAALPLLVRVTA